MTPEIREYVRSIVDAAPPLNAADAERLRTLMASGPRPVAECGASPEPLPIAARAKAA